PRASRHPGRGARGCRRRRGARTPLRRTTRRRKARPMTTRSTGLALAFATACISGVSIYVNGHAVRHFGDATVYTTAKNLVAGLLLLVLALTALRPAAGARAVL